MKILAVLFLLFISCKKDKIEIVPAPSDCGTCETIITYQEANDNSYSHVENSFVLCDGKWRTVRKKRTIEKGVTLQGDSFVRIKTFSCHE